MRKINLPIKSAFFHQRDLCGQLPAAPAHNGGQELPGRSHPHGPHQLHNNRSLRFNVISYMIIIVLSVKTKELWQGLTIMV